METCLFEGKQVCAYDVTYSNYVLNYELKKQLKIAADEGKLICEECGREVILKAKNIQKKVPHFAHKVTDDRCPYSAEVVRESEEHKKGKMILYNYFKDKYPNEKPKLNYRFSSGRKADVYIEFDDVHRLVIEFQRTELDILDWQQRQAEYNKLGAKVIWLLSGNSKNLALKVKQIDLTFFQQVMLNELEKVAMYLDVEQGNIIFAKNMRFEDAFKKNQFYEELFIKSYKLEDILIHKDGQIECNYIELYKKAYSRYSKKCNDECIKKEAHRQVLIEHERLQLILAKERIYQERLREQKLREQAREENRKEIDNILRENANRAKPYRKVDIPYKYKVKYVLNGDEKSLESTAKYMAFYGGSDDFKIMKFIFKFSYLSGNKMAKEFYKTLMGKAGYGYEELVVEESSVEALVCPICGNKVTRKYGKYGPYVTCTKYPDCNFSFNL